MILSKTNYLKIFLSTKHNIYKDFYQNIKKKIVRIYISFFIMFNLLIL